MTTKERAGVLIGQVWIDAVPLQGALDRMESMVGDGGGGMVFTPNIDHVVNVERSPALRAAYDAASLSVVDGQPLVWASRLLGAPLPEKVSGSDLIPALLERAAERRYRVYLLGGGPGVAEEAALLLRGRNVEVVGADAARISLEASPEEDAVVERVIAARPDFLLVALGCPKQELFMHRCAARVRPAVCVGIGGTLDFITGRVKRAPRWMQRSGMEWLYRLAQEPRRLAWRYLVNDPRFLLVLARTLRVPHAVRVARLET